ncbi:conserved hypothetical protein [Ricinus communis]|uniref:Uncharacterized protein n=1 Tax=Ricinus communis TaxID=3988 RepID=B9S8C4_RICCO|nr:conserved hypothetical protein [Ricinus communis]
MEILPCNAAAPELWIAQSYGVEACYLCHPKQSIYRSTMPLCCAPSSSLQEPLYEFPRSISCMRKPEAAFTFPFSSCYSSNIEASPGSTKLKGQLMKRLNIFLRIRRSPERGAIVDSMSFTKPEMEKNWWANLLWQKAHY